MDKKAIEYAFGVLGFLVCFLVTIAAEYLLITVINELSGKNYMPRGGGWFVVSVMGGITGFLLASDFARKNTFRLENRTARIVVAAVLSYLILWPGFILLFDPFDYGSYWTHRDWVDFFKMTIIPLVALSVVGALGYWAAKRAP